MARIILITGGNRSGKSAYAQALAEYISGIRTYVATCPVIDEETEKRIRKHKEARLTSSWRTIEETKNLADALKRARESQVILVDCLTLWVNNLMYEAESQSRDITEEDIAALCRGIIDVCDDLPGMIIFVTNEVGMGIVPENPASRLFRDLTGRCNQIIAGRADAVTFMISGLPVNIKGDKII